MTPTLSLEVGPSLKNQDKRSLSVSISPVQKLSESHLIHRTQALKLPPPGLALALSSLLVLFSDAARALWLPLLLRLGHLCLPHPPVILLPVLTRSLPSAAPTSLTQAHQDARILGWSSCVSAARLLSPVALGPWPQF